MERKIEFLPVSADSDIRDTGVEVRFSVIGPEGAVVFTIDTQWHLRSTHARLNEVYRERGDVDGMISASRPLPQAAIVYSRSTNRTSVEFVVEGRDFDNPMGWRGRFFQRICTLDPDVLLDRLRLEGQQGVFAALEEEYRSQFRG
jgi:hypothetical protein